MTILKILVAHDLSEAANRALLFAARLAGQLGAELHMVHVLADMYDGRSEPETAIPWITGDQTQRYVHFLSDELQRVATKLIPERAASVQIHVLRGDPVKRILALTDEVAADVVCVASTGKGGVQRILLGSVSQSLVRESKVPVLTVH